MLFSKGSDIYVRKNWAWTRAVNFCGGVTACSRLLGVNQSTVSKWLSNPRKKIPYEHAVFISYYTKIPLEYLSPLTKKANETIQEMSLAHNPAFVYEPTL
jgi:DNA-binding transcriptional regulator YdaS (Cro superfamily)